MRSRKRSAVLAILMVLALAPAAYAGLERMGPISDAPTIGHYPAWFQDKTGLTVEFCDLTNQAELNGGWCLLIPPAPATAPEHFPDNFFGEHFYWAATNVALHQSGTRVRFVMALEGAFVNNAVVPGDQMTFGRLRIVINPIPFSGDYKVIQPYGEWVFPGQVAGDRLFFTEDIGIACPGTFECTLGTSIGPFLLPSATPGGPEVPPIPDLLAGQDPFYDALVTKTAYPGTGKKYIADPGRIGPVTGSPLPPFVGSDGATHDHNTLRIEGPNGFVFDLPNNFAVMGRVMTGQLPGKVNVERASYATGTGNKLDVFANAFPTTQGRVPAQPPVAAVTPVLTFFEAACGGALTTDPVTGITTVNPPPYTAPAALEHPMANSGSDFWGQSTPAVLPTPPYVCVEDYTARNATGQVMPAFYLKKMTDDVSISNPLAAGQTPAAYFDGPGGGNLTVKAGSSDPTATLTLAGFGAGVDLVGGIVTIPSLAAPPAKVQVVSTAGGSAELPVTTAVGVAAIGGVPVAVNDDLPAMFEDCSPLPATSCAAPLVINPLTNDTYNGGAIPAGATVTITIPPRIGTMSAINPDGSFSYTPNPNVNGAEGIGYTVTVGGVISNQAYITIPITPVNDYPSANNDTTGAVVNKLNSVNVLANDTDPDGAADLARAVIVTWPPQLGAQPAPTGGTVSFTPTATGTFSFTYRAQDTAGLQSATAATVTVNVAAAEAIVPAKATYTQAKGRWVVSGTASPIEGQSLTIKYDLGTPPTYKVNGVCTALTAANNPVIGTTVVDATGAWLFDQTLSSTAGLLNPNNSGGNSTGFWCSPPKTLRITDPVLGGTAAIGISLK